MNKKRSWKKFNIMLSVMFAYALIAALIILQWYITNHPYYKSNFLTTIGNNRIFKKDIVRIEISHIDKETVVVENKEDIDIICNWIKPISGYRINSTLVTTWVYNIKFYLANGSVFQVCITPRDFRIRKTNIFNDDFKIYSLDNSYYYELTDLINSLSK